MTINSTTDDLIAEIEQQDEYSIRLHMDDVWRLCDEAKAMKARIAELEKDSARLDWLIAEGQDGAVVEEGSSEFWVKWSDGYGDNKYQDGKYPTGRAAIDSAMKASP